MTRSRILITLRNPEVRSVVFLAAVCGLLWVPRLDGPIDLRYDAGVYYVLGTSLAQGKGYRLLNEPGEPQAVQYPPLLPVFVAAHEYVLGADAPTVVGPWLRRSYAVLFLLYALAAYAMARQFLSPTYALLTALMTALFWQGIFLSDLLFAEMPFALVTVLFVITSRARSRGIALLGSGLLGAAAYLIRTAGIALLAAWVAESAFRKQWKQLAARATLALIPIAGWQWYVSRVTSSDEYHHPAYAYQRASYQYYNVTYAKNVLGLIDPFTPERGSPSVGDLAGRFGANLLRIPPALGEGVTAIEAAWEAPRHYLDRYCAMDWLPGWLVWIPPTLVGSLVIVGGGALWARGERLVPLYLAASAFLMCTTPWPGQFSRYMTPLTPFLGLCIVELLAVLRGHHARFPAARWPRCAWIVTVVIVSGALAVEAATTVVYFAKYRTPRVPYPGQRDENPSLVFFYDDHWKSYHTTLTWLRDHAGSADVVATIVPQGVYLRTGLRAVMPPMEADPAKAQCLLDSVPVRYLIVDDLQFLDIGRRYTNPVVEKYRRAWQPVYTAPDGKTRVYRRIDR